MNIKKHIILLTLTACCLVFKAQSTGKSVQMSSSVPSEDQTSIAKQLLDQYLNKRSSYIDSRTKEFDANEQLELDGILSQLKTTNEGSFEYHYASYIHNGRKTEDYHLLEKADNAFPDNPELYDDFMYHFHQVGDLTSRRKFSNKLYSSNLISSEILEYNYNVLMSIEQDGVLFVNGALDCNPLFIWQDVKGKRKDVKIVHIEMLNDPVYVSKLKAQLNISFSQGKNSYETLSDILKSNNNQSFYVGHTISKKVMEEHKANLYLTGLAMKYSTRPINNTASMVSKYESSFDLKLLKRTQTNRLTTRYNMNYLLFLTTVLQRYNQTSENIKAKQVRNLILKIAKEGGEKDKIETYLKSKGL